jgi:hypothetical protein
MCAWLLAHWLPFAGVGITALAFAFPAISIPILRFLVGTEPGRYLLLAAVAVTTFRYYGDLRYDAGHAAAVAEQARATARAQQVAHEQTVKRDGQSDAATADARSSADTRLTDHNQRAARVEGIAREPRPPVPAVCPGPDPRLTHELRDGGSRLRAAEGRLRSLGTAAGGDTH